MAIHCIRRCLNTLYIYNEGAIQSEVVPGLNHVTVVRFYPVVTLMIQPAHPTSKALIDWGYIHTIIHGIKRCLNTFNTYKMEV